MSKPKETDILLEFFQHLITDKKEQQVLEMVFENLGDDEIIEKLIEYKPASDKP